MKRLKPWLITQRDLQRYTYRAIDQCRRGRTFLLCHRMPDGARTLFALAPAEDFKMHAYMAFADMDAGRVKKS